MNEIKSLNNAIDRINDVINKLNETDTSNYFEHITNGHVIRGLNIAETIILQELEVIKNG